MASVTCFIGIGLCFLFAIAEMDACVHVDYAFNFDGKAYIVSGSDYYELNQKGSEVGRGNIASLFPNIPSGIQTATWWPGYDKLFFFKGTQHYTATIGDHTVKGPFSSHVFGPDFDYPMSAAVNHRDQTAFVRDCFVTRFIGTQVAFRKNCKQWSIPENPDAAIFLRGAILFIQGDKAFISTMYGGLTVPNMPLKNLIKLKGKQFCA